MMNFRVDTLIKASSPPHQMRDLGELLHSHGGDRFYGEVGGKTYC